MCIVQKINHAYKIGTVKQANSKSRTYYVYNHIIDLENFKQNLLKFDKKSYKNISIYNIGYITIKKNDDCENINSVNPLYLCSIHASGYIEEINGSNYLIFDSTDENKKVTKRYSDVFNRIKDKIKEVCGDEYNSEKDFMKIKFSSDDNLPL